MEDNVWEYPFGDLEDDDDDMFFGHRDWLISKTPHIKSFRTIIKLGP